MRFTTVFSVALLNALVFVTPNASAQVTDSYDSCNPSWMTCIASVSNGGTKEYQLDRWKAEDMAKKAGFTTGPGGEPQRFQIQDDLGLASWCRDRDVELWSFPILSEAEKYNKDLPVDEQRITPMRVVYLNMGSDKAFYCGTVIHSKIDTLNRGSGPFNKCKGTFDL